MMFSQGREQDGMSQNAVLANLLIASRNAVTTIAGSTGTTRRAVRCRIKYHTTVCLFGLIVSDPGHNWNQIGIRLGSDGTRMYHRMEPGCTKEYQIDIEPSRNFSLTTDSVVASSKRV